MDKSVLVRVLGFGATLVHGDTLVLDRWLWLKRRLPMTRNDEKLLDVGCGTGAFSIGAARRGYDALGLSWDERNQRVATERAKLCGATTARFEPFDIRQLDTRTDLVQQFDVVICCETIEHVLDDRKLMRDMANCLKPGGRLLLTTPHLLYRHMGEGELGPFRPVEDGDHVRRGYSAPMLQELCNDAGLVPERISYCSGFVSQKTTALLRTLERVSSALAWIVVLPLRALPPLTDQVRINVLDWPSFSICLEAYKPRW